jgi:hypothetical protein
VLSSLRSFISAAARLDSAAARADVKLGTPFVEALAHLGHACVCFLLRTPSTMLRMVPLPVPGRI